MKKVFLFFAVIAMFLASCDDNTARYKIQYDNGVKAIITAEEGYIVGDTIVIVTTTPGVFGKQVRKVVIIHEMSE